MWMVAAAAAAVVVTVSRGELAGKQMPAAA
jgi:hypothetical protein